MSEERAEWADVAKGIGILLVVLGHNQINSFVPEVHQYVYSFHMPLFFMLSGMFFKPQAGFFDLLRRRFGSILRPFLIIEILIYGVSLFLSSMPVVLVLKHFAKSLFYSLPSTLEWLPMWFLPHLFLLNLFAWVLITLIYSRLPKVWLRLLFLGGMLWLGVVCMRAAGALVLNFGWLQLEGGLPWSIDLLLVTAVFFILGFELRRSLHKAILGSNWTLLICGVVWLIINLQYPVTVDLAARSYDFFPVATLGALTGSLFVLSLSIKLERIGGPLFTVLKTLGNISIIILIFHGMIQYFIFYKTLDLVSNVNLAAAIAFCTGVGIPFLIWFLLLRGNPRLAGWFSVPP